MQVVFAPAGKLCKGGSAKKRSSAQAKTYANFTLTKPSQAAMVTNLLATPVRSDVPIPADVAPLVNADAKLVWFQDEEFAAARQKEWLDRYTREVQS